MFRLGVFSLFIIFLFAFSVGAQEALELTGERLQYRLGEEEVVVYEGKVSYKDISLTADYIHIFLEKKELEAEGKVVVERGEEGAQAEKAYYNWEMDWLSLEKVRSDLTGKSIEGKFYFRGEEVKEEKIDGERKTEVEGAHLTSCDLEEPHYYIEAKRLVIYPDEKVEIYDLSYWDFGHRLLSLPFYVFFLNRKEQLPFLPVVGHSADLGFYFSYFYNYFVNDYSFGTITLDWWQHGGWGLGVTHYLEREGEEGRLTIYYRDPASSSSTLRGSVKYSKEVDEFTDLSLNLDYSGTLGEADDRYSGFISLLRAKDKSTSKLNLSYSANESSNTENLYTTWNYQYKLRDGLTGELNLNYKEYEKRGEFVDQDLAYGVTFKKASDLYTYYLRYSGHTDLEGDAYTGDSNKVVFKIPELEVARGKEKIGESDFTYKAGLLLGHYFEEETGVIDERLRLTLNLEGKSEVGGGDLTSFFNFQQDFYGNGFARYIWLGGIKWVDEISPDLSLTLSYQRGDYDGATPFKFDYVRPRTNYLSLGLDYDRSPWGVSLDTGYDFREEEFVDALFSIEYNLEDNKKVELSGSYDITDNEWGSVVFGIAWPMNKEWGIDFSGRWDPQEGEIDGVRVGLTNDLHCREISLFYDQSRDTFWLEYGIKALPGEKIKLGG